MYKNMNEKKEKAKNNLLPGNIFKTVLWKDNFRGFNFKIRSIQTMQRSFLFYLWSHIME